MLLFVSLAVQLTVVVPRSKIEPESFVQVNDAPGRLSETVTVKETWYSVEKIVEGQERLGLLGSLTVKEKAH